MNKTNLFLVLLASTLYAQKSPISFGQIPMEDMTMKYYAPDSSAVAVILTDFGKAYVSITSVNIKLYFERHTRIKILKKEGLNWADVVVPVYHANYANEERIINLKASTFNLENGKIVESQMDNNNVFKEKFNRYFNLQKFTLPNVKEGSVLEYSYTIQSDFLTNFPDWQFQHDIPVRHSEYWAIIPDFFVMKKFIQGYLPVTSYETKNFPQRTYTDKAHGWIIKNVPAFKSEPYITNDMNYVSKIYFGLSYINSSEIMGSWEKLNTDLLESESFGRAITGSAFLKKKTKELIAGENDAMKKIEKIYRYIQSELEWNGQYDFLCDNLKDVFERKKGSSGDINLALASMLDKAGFLVDMVLISTRDHGFIRKEFPMIRQFNHVVCAVRIDGRPYLLDATDKYLPVGVIPQICMNGEGLMISKNFFGWFPLETKIKAKTVIQADLQLQADGDLEGSVTFMHDGYEGAAMRRKYAAGEKEYLKHVQTMYPKWNFNSSSFEHVKESDKPFKETHQLDISEFADVAGTQLYLTPFIAGNLAKNPFTKEQRTYPVDYGSPVETVYLAKIIVPEGYHIEELPQSKILTMPGNLARFSYSITQLGNVINIASNFQINRYIFSQDEYPMLREFYNQVVAKQNEQIVIRKKT